MHLKLTVILITLLLSSAAPIAAVNKAPYLDTARARDLSSASSQDYLIYFITPTHKKACLASINNDITKAASKLDPQKQQKMQMLYGAKYTPIEEQSWDDSNQVGVLVVPERPGFTLDNRNTANRNAYPIESSVIVNKNYEVICEPLKSTELIINPKILTYIDSVYHNHSKGILRADSIVQIGSRAVFYEFASQCFDQKETTMLLVKNYLNKSAKSTISKSLKKLILDEF
jgi:hypothetical protein